MTEPAQPGSPVEFSVKCPPPRRISVYIFHSVVFLLVSAYSLYSVSKLEGLSFAWSMFFVVFVLVSSSLHIIWESWLNETVEVVGQELQITRELLGHAWFKGYDVGLIDDIAYGKRPGSSSRSGGLTMEVEIGGLELNGNSSKAKEDDFEQGKVFFRYDKKIVGFGAGLCPDDCLRVVEAVKQRQ